MAFLRAVIYCRCSTEEESQADALRKQILESETCIREHGWSLEDKYVELKSGTTTRGRTEYNRLFEDLMTDKFDIIVIKSQDRLMRNVKDWYLFLDRMLKRGKRLFMYIEGKFYTADDALITGIKAILAEEYSRELSKKINNAHRHRQTNGGKAMLNSRAFGFAKLPDGSVKVVEEEAEVIRKIYEYSAAGYGSRAIANLFFRQGYVKRTGNSLTAVSVGRIIRNPLYKGVMVMNRVHYDFERKKTIKNPEEQWIYQEGAVPAIVDSMLWEEANQAMNHRAECSCRKIQKKGNSMGKYDLSGKIVCGRCGKLYYRTWRQRSQDKEETVIEWKCSNYLERGRRETKTGEKIRKMKKEYEGGCDSVHLDEKVVFDILEQVSRQYFPFGRQDKDRLLNQVLRILKKVFGEIPVKPEWERLEKEEKRLAEQKDVLLTKLLGGVISDEDYERKNKELEKIMAGLKQKEEELKQKEGEVKNWEQRIEKIRVRLERGGLEKAIAAGMLCEIKEIRVHEWKLELCFDSREDALWVDYPFGPQTVRGRYLDRRRIVELIGKEPCMTAGKLAEEMGRSVYMVRNRMEELVKGGYIRFRGRGGHGVWEILKELPDKEDSIRAGGL